MSLQKVLRAQWDDYQRTHATRANFVVHLLTVPVFLVGTAAFFWGVATVSWGYCLMGLLAVMGAMAAQGWGHQQEASRPAPFASRTDVCVRIFLEQWVTFPRYAVRVAMRALMRR